MQSVVSLKYFLYDWLGYNALLSEFIQSMAAHRPVVLFFRFITELGNFHLFPIAFGLLSLILFVLLRKNKRNATQQGIAYMKCLAILFLNLAASSVLLEVMKESFGLLRPYCLPSFDLNKYVFAVAYSQAICTESFPSGHATYICLLVVSFWSVLNKDLKIVGAVLIVLVAVSRVVLAKHFLADVVYGSMLALLVINPLNTFLVARYFPKCKPLAKKLLEKLL
jgi:membrane-associated phospholipid phosphatase